jgi:hypothetical protein
MLNTTSRLPQNFKSVYFYWELWKFLYLPKELDANFLSFHSVNLMEARESNKYNWTSPVISHNLRSFLVTRIYLGGLKIFWKSSRKTTLFATIKIPKKCTLGYMGVKNPQDSFHSEFCVKQFTAIKYFFCLPTRFTAHPIMQIKNLICWGLFGD